MDSGKVVQNINIDLIIPNRFQPRLIFDDKALNELAASIKEHGIIEPLIVRKVADKYEIIAGERRYKASILAGLNEVPCVIVNFDDNKSAQVALIENVQRRNLNAIEEAKSYKNIIDKNHITQDELAKKIGVSQSSIANKMRLLNLSSEVQTALINNQISERHARSLLTLNDPTKELYYLNKIISQRLTVKELDDLINTENLSSFNQTSTEPAIEKFNIDERANSLLNDPLFTNDNVLDRNLSSNVNSNISSNFDNIYNNNVNNFTNSNMNNDSKNIYSGFDSNDSTKEEIEHYDEKIDMLDSNDDSNINNNDDFQVNAQNLFKIFGTKNRGPIYDSLENQVTNLSMGNDEFINPLDNDLVTDNNNNNINLNDNKVYPLSETIEEEVELPKRKIEANNIDSVKFAFDELEKEISNAGYKISKEDYDFNDLYQIIIKIDK